MQKSSIPTAFIFYKDLKVLLISDLKHELKCTIFPQVTNFQITLSSF